ncbi:MAG TPA: hypothetical protein VMM76_15080 [Pirellulaceae bacterium]|nr:hypothetical protein [Pirellulaceae bacterium]
MSKTRVPWLHTNRRALWLGIVVLSPALLIAIGCVTLAADTLVRWIAAAAALVLAYAIGLCVYLMFQPRLSYANERLCVRLRPGPPLQVPIEIVECFFLGQGPTLLPRPFGKRDKVEETSTIVVRLAESADQWKHFDVKPALGLWCDGYITIRGTWCEPITNELLKRLNGNLIAAHREVRAKAQAELAIHAEPTPPAREQEVR